MTQTHPIVCRLFKSIIDLAEYKEKEEDLENVLYGMCLLYDCFHGTFDERMTVLSERIAERKTVSYNINDNMRHIDLVCQHFEHYSIEALLNVWTSALRTNMTFLAFICYQSLCRLAKTYPENAALSALVDIVHADETFSSSHLSYILDFLKKKHTICAAPNVATKRFIRS